MDRTDDRGFCKVMLDVCMWSGVTATDGYEISGSLSFSSSSFSFTAQTELCESRCGRPGLSVLTSLTVSVDVKQH